MARAVVKQPLGVAADKAWELIADFGNVGWMPVGTKADLEGSGPGMARIIQAGDVRIAERLESIDEPNRTLVYVIPENVPFPVTDYRSTMVVTGDATESELEWSCTFEPVGVPAAEATTMIEGMYATMSTWIRDHLAK
jgi:hypothetical protein